MAAARSTQDAVLASAVDLARAAAEEVAGQADLVGDHLGVVVEGERLISHRFASTSAGYRGWYWSVTVARVPRGRTATVCEVDLLPGEDAILGRAWVPWSERLRPGDVGPGDVLPYLPEDERLDQGYESIGDADADQMAIFELGLGRERVLSRLGRSEAAERWYRGSRGPTAPQALAASAPCSTCGFLTLLAGSLRTEFGVCANEWSPDDGRVVSMDHGCGAHSQTDVPAMRSDWPDAAPVLDEMDLELVLLVDRGAEEKAAAGQTAAEEPAEPASEEPTEPEVAKPTEPAAGSAGDEPGAEEPTADEPDEAEPAVPGEE